jgi:hypothetical protein
MSIIYIDADACPVRKETLKVGARYSVKTIMVSNGGIRPSNDPLVEIVIVAHGADIADDWIEEQVKANDIVITQDILLAKRCLDKKAFVLGVNGKEFSEQNIGYAISMREFNQHLRETGEGGNFNKAHSASDRSRFLQALDLMVQRANKA